MRSSVKDTTNIKLIICIYLNMYIIIVISLYVNVYKSGFLLNNVYHDDVKVSLKTEWTM